MSILNVLTPTTRTHTRTNGETVHVTEWTIGAYTLRKTEDPDYTDWGVLAADRNLPRVEDVAGFGQTAEFGVSCTSVSDMAPDAAVAYAGQIAEAAMIAKRFNKIVAAD